MRRNERLPDDTEDIELPRYSRYIGVARGPVADPAAAASTGAFGILTPFVGVLGGPMEPGGHAAPAFSYLALRPLVLERVVERESVIVRSEISPRVEPDRPETRGDLRVRHLLRNDPVPPGIDRSAIDEPRSVVDEPRSVPRAERESSPGAVRDLAVLDTVRSRDAASDDRPERPAEPIRNVTVLGDERLTVLERIGSREPPATDPDREPATDRGELPPPVARRPDGSTGAGDPPTLSPPPTVRTVTNTTVRRSTIPPPAPGTGNVGLRIGAASGPTAPSIGDGPRNLAGDREAMAPAPARTTLAAPARSPAAGSPELTVVTARSGPERGGAEPPGTDGDRTNGRGTRTGSPLGGDRPVGRNGREGPPQRPRQDTTMEALFDDSVEMNRLVDRLYREFQRKTRIERERRGL